MALSTRHGCITVNHILLQDEAAPCGSRHTVSDHPKFVQAKGTRTERAGKGRGRWLPRDHLAVGYAADASESDQIECANCTRNVAFRY